MSNTSQKKKKKLIEIEIGIDIFLERFFFFPFLAIIHILEVAVISVGRRNQ